MAWPAGFEALFIRPRDQKPPGRPLPACPAGESVRRLDVLMHNFERPLPACPAGEGVLAAHIQRVNFLTCRTSRQGSQERTLGPISH